MAIPPDDLFLRQEIELEKYTTRRVRNFIALLEKARRELLDSIGDPDTYTAQRVFKLVEQIDDIGLNLQADLKDIGIPTREIAKMVKGHLEESISVIADTSVNISMTKLNTEVLRKFSENELLHVTNLTKIEIQRIKNQLFTQVGVKGVNPRQLAKKLAGKNGQFAGRYGHIETILRTEHSTIYNTQSLEGIQDANQKHDLSLNKRIIETMDAKRNHPISRVLNNQVVASDKPFKAKVSEVEAQARLLKRGNGRSGVFWPIQDGYFVGQRLPAHYRERGIIVPTAQPPTKL